MAGSKAKDDIHRARTRLLSSHPFYGYIACRLKLREVNELPASFATDGEHLFYNPALMKDLSKPKLVGRIAHESEHVYLNHPARMASLIGCWSKHPNGQGGELEPHECYLQIAQVSADYAINPHLKDGGFDIDDGIFPEQQYWKDSLEQHYKRVKKSAKKVSMPIGGGCAGCQAPKGKDGKPLSQSEMAKRASDLQQTIINAANFAKLAGKLPADIERMLESIRAPKVAWFDVLRRFMQATTKNDYRMLPPNRRYIHQGLYLPSLRSESVSDVLLIVDGSGSTHDVFPQFISEFASILLDVRPENLHIMVWDTRCTWQRVFDNFNDETATSLAAMQSEMGAGGGSVFTECFDYFAKETGVTPAVAIVLTDMEIYWPSDPGYPVLWVATTDNPAPFGETVRMEV